jgi:hypothetical protein
MRQKPSNRVIGLIVINLLIFVVTAELVGLFLNYIDTGELYYLHHASPAPIQETSEHRLTGEGLHPYFGQSHRPGVRFDVPPSLQNPATPAQLTNNNFGFVSPHDYPFAKTRDDQYIVGLFGGSVGVWFCQVAAPRLLEDLRRSDLFKNRELVPLCFSHEGYKQPQQLLVLAYFLSIGQQFDLVLNIDGFNEVALGALNDQHGLDPSMPSAQHIEPLINLIDQATLTPAKVLSLAAIERDKQRLNQRAERMERTPFAAVHVVLDRLYRRTLNHYYAELGRFANLPSSPRGNSLILPTAKVKAREGDALFEDIASNWVTSSLLMHQMLSQRGVPYFHVLQPNQYYGTRRFGADESKVALMAGSPFKASAEHGYPFLERRAAALRGIRFFSGIHAFDDEPRPVYMDNCCHYTLAGNYRLADFIAARILESLKQPS